MWITYGQIGQDFGTRLDWGNANNCTALFSVAIDLKPNVNDVYVEVGHNYKFNWVALLFGSFGIFGFRSKFWPNLIKIDENLIRNRLNCDRKTSKITKFDQKWLKF